MSNFATIDTGGGQHRQQCELAAVTQGTPDIAVGIDHLERHRSITTVSNHSNLSTVSRVYTN